MMSDLPSKLPPRPDLSAYQLSHLRDAAEDIAERFHLDEVTLAMDEEAQAAYDTLHQRLKAEVVALLARRPEKLMQLLYRIDVSEAKVTAAFHGPMGDALADRLTHLIIERQLQKMLLRQQMALSIEH